RAAGQPPARPSTVSSSRRITARYSRQTPRRKAVGTMRNAQPTGLDPAHILAVCARSTDGRRGLAVRQSDGIVVCLVPSRRTAYRASAALARVGYEVTGVSASRGRDLIITGWDPAALDARLAIMRAALHWFADQPSSTAQLVIERFRGLPDEARTPQQ